MQISQSAVHESLSNYLPGLRAAIESAVAEYGMEYSPAVRRKHSRRTVASSIHDHIVYNIAALVASNPELDLRPCKQLWVLSFPGREIIRFKKVGSSKISSGHYTDQVRKFRNQQCIEEMPGMPEPINLDLSYELNSDKSLRAVYLICPAGLKSNMWASEITELEEVSSVVVNLFDKINNRDNDQEGAKLLPKVRSKDEEGTES